MVSGMAKSAVYRRHSFRQPTPIKCSATKADGHPQERLAKILVEFGAYQSLPAQRAITPEMRDHRRSNFNAPLFFLWHWPSHLQKISPVSRRNLHELQFTNFRIQLKTGCSIVPNRFYFLSVY